MVFDLSIQVLCRPGLTCPGEDRYGSEEDDHVVWQFELHNNVSADPSLFHRECQQ